MLQFHIIDVRYVNLLYLCRSIQVNFIPMLSLQQIRTSINFTVIPVWFTELNHMDSLVELCYVSFFG